MVREEPSLYHARVRPFLCSGYGRLLVTGAIACGPPASSDNAAAPPPFDPGPVPTHLASGAALFLGACRGCHGVAGSGFAGGPPLLDTLYLRPGFSDSAIRAAILTGVRRHHWDFDDMPPVRTVRPDEIPAIVAYIRWIQDRWNAARDSAATRGS
jgi:mono/diheme cytochrome c family protein